MEKPADISACRKTIPMFLPVPENQEIQCPANQSSAKQPVAHMAKHPQQRGNDPANHQAQDNLHSRAAQNTIHVEHFTPLLCRSVPSGQEQDKGSQGRNTGSNRSGYL